MNIDLRLGDCLEVLKTIPDNSVDSIITDPPYGIGFMGKAWDTFVPTNVANAVEQSEISYEKTKDDKQDNPNLKGRKNAPIGSKSTFAGTYDLTTKGKNEYQEWCYEWGKECLRVLKPGGHLLASNSPRMYHRMTIGLEDAGFEIRDQIMWVYGSGFPKSHNIGKAIDKIQGNDREVVGVQKLQGTAATLKGKANRENWHDQGEGGTFTPEVNITKGNSEWEGWGTALKPAHEPIVMARKPLSEKSIAENVLKHGTGGINIDGSRIEFEDTQNAATNPKFRKENNYKMPEPGQESNGAVSFTSSKNEYDTSGRFPANIIFDEEAGQLLDEQSGISKSGKNKLEKGTGGIWNKGTNLPIGPEYGDKGGASRFFYCPKAAKKDRNEGLDHLEEKVIEGRDEGQDERNVAFKIRNKPRANVHPTVKPTDLMRYLINLITPPNGTILDPFMGSGSTGKAAVRCGVNFIGIEKEQEYMDIASARIEHERNKPVQTKLF
jgi:site-specific DNA-methyltransferase (adenine-specific)